MRPYGRATPHQITHAHISEVTGLTFVTSITHYKSLPSTKLLNKIRQVIIRILLYTQYNYNLDVSSKVWKSGLGPAVYGSGSGELVWWAPSPLWK